MNYLSHCRRFLKGVNGVESAYLAYFVAGVATPDWLSVIDRKIRARSPRAREHVASSDTILSTVAKGVIQHHYDDRWFHTCETFVMMNAQFSRDLRKQLPDEDSLRSNFVAHVAIELIMDACLLEIDADMANQYYDLLSTADFQMIENAVSVISGKPINGRLAQLIPRFIEERFLCDYHEDRSLLRRLNHVMRRVGLDALPNQTTLWLKSLRHEVRNNLDMLFDGEQDQLAWSM